ncbi:hypothetical protein OHV05_10120 [Kitasatospora sp. NBC_00070]|uniref:hypothetical protein n=1 Tax=Kitasatospora sp. NBC_00070 TaxID=2975962 RepID=UPI003253C609
MPDTRPHPAVLTAGGVFLPAEVCHPLWLALRAQLDRHRGSGGQVRPEVADALAALRAAALNYATSPDGHAGRTPADIDAPSTRQLVTTSQLATRLGVTERHARRLAASAQLAPAARNLWHPDDADHLAALRRQEHH